MTLSASLLDFKYLSEAKEAYSDKNYSKAQALYAKVNHNEAKFNQADALYRQKKYQEAIDLYETIEEPKLKAKIMHNIGNSYAQLEKIDKAIDAYQKALEINQDSDTKFNLELLKKKKEEKKQKDKDNKKDSDKKENQKKSEEEKRKESQKKQKRENQKEEENKKNNRGEENQTQPPISNMEERKWQKMLNQRGVETLMIPLNKGKKDNETNLW
jgi:Ca-activated chloride channel family protein